MDMVQHYTDKREQSDRALEEYKMKCRLLECEIANHQKTLDVYRTDYDQLKEMIETEELYHRKHQANKQMFDNLTDKQSFDEFGSNIRGTNTMDHFTINTSTTTVTRSPNIRKLFMKSRFCGEFFVPVYKEQLEYINTKSQSTSTSLNPHPTVMPPQRKEADLQRTLHQPL
ncbi:hypothetical protein PPL_09381 [Heterostelium album PN500]|uniref:Uncharacterized protein n=1 Tax=Heterostelium pallidum (strain ATCC 26659 / Pp 5 / PN500) TaxID=670386 RepID=D3BLE7_HETP5|nr:hypothetical protein PPL_09381 [Heterostelium album PN500]EFA77881.1 hypothetical protein PPL_09381 [Heterostelium album PN500]|eukprot:XP_020430009.1 hypothetical protein PPL_09381 [Heterostelium album PN500]